MSLTIDQVHLWRIQTKADLEALADKHTEERKPLDERMKTIDAWLFRYLEVNGLENAKTEHAMTYKTVVRSVTVKDWDALLDWILLPSIERFAEAMENGGTVEQAKEAAKAGPELGFLNHAVNKTAVLEMLEQKEHIPPGVGLTSLVQVNTRKA